MTKHNASHMAYDEGHVAAIQSALRWLQTAVKRAQDDGLKVELETVEEGVNRFNWLRRLPVSDWKLKATRTYE